MLESYAVAPVAGLKPSNRRAIAFLVSRDDGRTSAQDAFNRLAAKKARDVRSRFDFWIDFGINDDYFHGWPNHPKYKGCWVFKWKDNRQRHRLYGFLVNPLPLGNASFQLCVLVLHATKNERETDTAELDRINALRADPRVKAAIDRTFGVRKKGCKQWVN